MGLSADVTQASGAAVNPLGSRIMTPMQGGLRGTKNRKTTGITATWNTARTITWPDGEGPMSIMIHVHADADANTSQDRLRVVFDAPSDLAAAQWLAAPSDNQPVQYCEFSAQHHSQGSWARIFNFPYPLSRLDWLAALDGATNLAVFVEAL